MNECDICGPSGTWAGSVGRAWRATGWAERPTYPVVMARSHLTLAALATSAVAGLDVVGTQPFGAGRGSDFDAALLTGRDGRHWIIRVPRNERAEAEQSADLVALRALSAGVRTRLPFAVSTFAGQVPVDGTRAVVYEFVYGTKVPLQRVRRSSSRRPSARRSPPSTPCRPASSWTPGCPCSPPSECLRATIEPHGPRRRDRPGARPRCCAAGSARSRTSTLWQFQPTVVNGALGADSFLSANGEVTGVLGWHELRVGDPARDLQWLLGARDEA